MLSQANGTFLLRYSDSEMGGLTIAWVAENQDGIREVYNLQPFTTKDFQIRPLADRINDLKHLVYLYPDIAKDQVSATPEVSGNMGLMNVAQAFGKYYTQLNDNQPQPNGYVKPMLVVQIPG